MNIAYDEAKSAANNLKHGVPLSHARFIEWSTLWSKPDTRRDYGEERIIGYAYIGPACSVSCSRIAATCVASSVCARLTTER